LRVVSELLIARTDAVQPSGKSLLVDAGLPR
jgi:hypothetical protein